MFKNVGDDLNKAFNPSLCPICGKDNVCNNLVADEYKQDECWCQNPTISFPQALLDTVPENAKGTACICQSCVLIFKVE